MKNISSTKSLFALLGAVLLSLWTPTFAAAQNIDPPSRAGRVSYIEGSVLFYDAQAGWRDAVINYPVTSQNSLATRGPSRAEVRVGSTALRIAADSQLDLLAVTDNLIDARLAQGSLNVRVRNLESGDSVRVSTLHTQAIIRTAGRYRIDVDNQATRVTVLQGAAGVMLAGNRESVLYAGTSTVVGVYGNPERQLETAQSDAFDDWAHERDYRFERSRSAQYVSPEMTGYEDLDNYGTWSNNASYGHVWIPSDVAPGWAPYQDGRWVNVQPWGWTWVDNAPWGFAPFHYGRWVQVNGYWAWAPGHFHARPVYAPALVAFVGDPGWQASFAYGTAPAVGWLPLGWAEPYYPYYPYSSHYGNNLNKPHVPGYVHHGRRDYPFIHRAFTTIVPRDKFTSPVVAVNQALKSAINPPVARTHPVAPPAPARTFITPAPGLDRTPIGVVSRVLGAQNPAVQPGPQPRDNGHRIPVPMNPQPGAVQNPQPQRPGWPVMQPAPAATTPAVPQPRNDSPWQRRPAPANPQAGVVQTPLPPQQPGRPAMQLPIPVAQPAGPLGPIYGPPQGVRGIDPARRGAPVIQPAPQNPVQQIQPRVAPLPAAKSDINSHRRYRESGDGDTRDRRTQSR